LDAVNEFLGIDKSAYSENKRENVIFYSEMMTETEWNYLMDVFEYEIKGLERILGWDCADWLFPPY
jgi:hypothetical protein